MYSRVIDFIKSCLESIGLKESGLNIIVLIFTFIGFIIGIVASVWRFIKWVSLRRDQKFLNRDLEYSNFTKNDVDSATRYYIPTYYQNVSPTVEEEPGRRYIASAKNKLIPLFLKEIFSNNIGNKFYLILADTGMGKTTMLINLYLAYKDKIKWSFSRYKYKIWLFPLGSNRSLDKIKKIDSKENSILLLDAFDEDVNAIGDYESRLKEILEIVMDFKIIVITCRTQFFPSQKEEPYETGYFSFGETNEEYKFQKLYLSPFDNRDVKRYIRKRFSIFAFQKKRAAINITKKSPNLAVRPMLLYHIADLIKAKRNFEYSFEIYSTLIENWIHREFLKPNIRVKYKSYQDYRKALYWFSHSLAIYIYKNRNIEGGYFIKNLETFYYDGKNIIDIDNEILTVAESEGKSKSLLNRDIEGNYKFSHRSIMEYFLAAEMIFNQEFYLNFNFSSMNSTSKFLEEMLINEVRKTKGTFINSESKEQLSNLNLKNYKAVTGLCLRELGAWNLFLLSKFSKLQELVIIDIFRFRFFYLVYMHYYLKSLSEENLDSIDRMEDVLESGEEISTVELRERIMLIQRVDIDKLIDKISEHPEFNELHRYLSEFKKLSHTEIRERFDFLRIKKLIRNFSLQDLNFYNTASVNLKEFEISKNQTEAQKEEKRKQREKTFEFLGVSDLASRIDVNDEEVIRKRYSKSSTLLLSDFMEANSIYLRIVVLKNRMRNCKIKF